MKKILQSLGLSFLMILMCALALTACDMSDPENNEHEHTFSEWKTVKASTCSEEGLQERSCACGEVEQSPLEKENHTGGEWIVDKEATKTENGMRHQICLVCSAEMAPEILYATGSQGLSYVVNEDGVTGTVNGLGTCTDSELYIPAYIDGYRITGVVGFTSCKTITGVVIAEGITTIGDSAFEGCWALASVVIPESCVMIGEKAFYECQMKTMAIPKQVETIGKLAFGHCSLSMSFSVDSENKNYKSDNGALYSKDGTVLIKGSIKSGDELKIPEGVVVIEDMAFRFAYVGGLSFPSTLKHIGDNAFEGLSVLGGRIVIPEGVKSIGDYAFYQAHLTSVEFPSTLSSVGEWAFSRNLLDLVKLPDNLTAISKGAFAYCSRLKMVGLPQNLVSLGAYAFYDTSLEKITLPATLSALDATALLDVNSAVDVIELEEGNPYYSLYEGHLYSKEGTVFVMAGKLFHSVTIRDGVACIGANAFLSRSSLDEVVIPASVTRIESGAFQDCHSLRKIHFQGTKGQWLAIEKHPDWDNNSYFGPLEYTVYCTDGNIEVDHSVSS